jgi:RimJ/RimL family protein N-acetyltransferase
MVTSISTERLLIRPLAISDSNFILELVNTEGWLKYVGDRDIHSQSTAEAYIQKILENPNTRYWVVGLRNTHTSVGIVTVIKRDYVAYPDIGCAFLAKYTNHGYAYESSKALLHHLIESRAYTHISAITKPVNYRSIKLLKKLGLEYAAEIDIKNEKSHLYQASVDGILIANITKSFYSVFTSNDSKRTNQKLLREICIPQMLVISHNKIITQILDLESYVESQRKILSDGTLTEIEEKELFSETKITGDLAARFSEYEIIGIVFKQKFRVKRVKILQFVKIKESWKLTSIVCEDREVPVVR